MELSSNFLRQLDAIRHY